MRDLLDRLNQFNLYPEPFTIRYSNMRQWAEEAKEHMFNSLYRQFIHKDERNTNCPLRLSALGLPAIELVCRKFFPQKMSEDTIGFKTRSIFYQGDMFEPYMNFVLKSIGYVVLEEQRVLNWNGVPGHSDSIVLDPETGITWLVEFKTMHHDKFTRIKNNGMDIPEYITQMATYRDATGLPGAWVIVNKNTSEILVLIADNEEVLESHRKRARFIIESFKKIEHFEDAFNYFSIPRVKPVERTTYYFTEKQTVCRATGAKLNILIEEGLVYKEKKIIGYEIPDEMRWSKYNDILYYTRPLKFKTMVEDPYYRYGN